VNSDPVNIGEPAAPSPAAERLNDGVRSIEHWYLQDFEKRVKVLAAQLRSQITEELKTQFDSELNNRVEAIRREYEERLYVQASEWQSERAQLIREIQELRKRVPSKDVQDEISATEAVMGATVSKTSRELERLIPDTTSLLKLLQSRVEELEMKAYLRGLKFRIKEEK
jgi:hypothetical protein